MKVSEKKPLLTQKIFWYCFVLIAGVALIFVVYSAFRTHQTTFSVSPALASALPDYEKWPYQMTASCSIENSRTFTFSAFVTTEGKGSVIILFLSDKKFLIGGYVPLSKEPDTIAIINGDGTLTSLDLKNPGDDAKGQALIEKAFVNEFGPTANEMLEARCRQQIDEIDAFISSIITPPSK